MEDDDPFGCKWMRAALTRVDDSGSLVVYRDLFDHITEESMTWDPYPASDLLHLPHICREHQHVWTTRSPLICFDIVEWHFPKRVFRQFGMRHDIPPPCDTSVELHKIDRCGRHTTNWRYKHASHLVSWEGRENSIQEGVPSSAPMKYDDPYLVWYRSITRLFISPLHPPRRVAFEPLVGQLNELYMMMHSMYDELTLDDDHIAHRLVVGMTTTRKSLTRAGAQYVVDSLPPVPSEPQSSADAHRASRRRPRQSQRRFRSPFPSPPPYSTPPRPPPSPPPPYSTPPTPLPLIPTLPISTLPITTPFHFPFLPPSAPLISSSSMTTSSFMPLTPRMTMPTTPYLLNQFPLRPLESPSTSFQTSDDFIQTTPQGIPHTPPQFVLCALDLSHIVESPFTRSRWPQTPEDPSMTPSSPRQDSDSFRK